LKTNVYIDGFNLYYGCLKGTDHRWLNIYKLAEVLLPEHDIQKVKYFTARIKPRPQDPDQGLRQKAYLRALQTIPKVSIIYGHFLTHEKTMHLVNPVNDIKYARVYSTEEKGSDVNLASHLLHDAHLGDYALAVVISNDSDLVEPIRLVIRDLQLPVGVYNPQAKAKHPSVQLEKTATFFKNIRPRHLEESQLPDQLSDSKGIITKPVSW
jgi:uncharacterized LabA/DUF88 family protein